MRKVLVFKETLLPPSETFILAQMRALRQYVPIIAGLEHAQPSLPLPQEPILLSARGRLISDARAKLYRRTGTAPRFHYNAKRSRPDLVHAHFASGGRTALPLARALRVPLLVTLHGADVTVRDPKLDNYRRLGEDASLFICVSQFIRDRALEAGFPAEKLLVHYIGIDRDVFSPSSS
ncbi:MAG: colanic acid/amylovoran biosynthesis glycosyltransferase, partial [Acidobacteriaceae bacterium]|nr:colanic acid/amylovoran biosynthesis glycosyltransferase [Acidobacteriaceae bacterium]